MGGAIRPDAPPTPPKASGSTEHTPGAGSDGKSYSVASGDTLYGIAVKFNTTASELSQLNKLDSPDMLSVGQVRKIP